MKITTERLERSQVLLNIEVESDVMERWLERAYRRIAGRTAIPGFRKGKAPRSLIERYVGRGALVDEALDLLIPEAYNQALDSEKIDAIDQPKIELVQAEPPVFKATVAVRPTIELPDYRDFSFTMATVEVTDEKVDEALDQLRQRSAPWEPVERPVAFGDLATIDLESTVQGDDGAAPFLNDTGINYPMNETFQYPLPGFPQEVVGMEVGVPKEFTLTFPDEYPQAEMVGKPVSFTVTVREIKEKKLPELNDEFAKGVGEGHETLESLKSLLRQQVQEDEERTVRREVEDQVVQALIDQTTLEYPDVLVEREIDHMMEDVIPSNLNNNQAKVEEYLESIGKTAEELREERRPEAVRRVVRSLVLGKVSEEEGISAGNDEVINELVRIVVNAGDQSSRMLQMFNNPQGHESIARILRSRKTIDKLVEYATGIPSPSTLAAMAAVEAIEPPAEAETPTEESAAQAEAPAEAAAADVQEAFPKAGNQS